MNKSKILITGVTGFVGSWLAVNLKDHYQVYGIALKKDYKNSLFNKLELNKKINIYHSDIQNLEDCVKIFKKIKPDFTIHLAAQPIISESIKDPYKTFLTNIVGTLNIFKCVQNYSSGIILNFTSDKVYFNRDEKNSFKETNFLKGVDPYSLSKSSTDYIGQMLGNSKLNYMSKIYVTTFRAGNIIGGADWGKDRLIPDYFRALKKKEKLYIRQKNSVRPWQHVCFVVKAISKFISSYKKDFQTEFNIGPKVRTNYKVSYILNYLNKLNDNKVKILYSSKKSSYEKKYLNINTKKFEKFFKLNYTSNLNKDLYLTNEIYMKVLKKDKNLINLFEHQLEQF